ncbi:MAG: biotin--[acetyl-CoA-carboxylase] ligase [Rhodospirillales bacterium]|nr:biotin--[acetyl-CoA-carboxylase] ligase [Rhodospirillales bacterium]
MNADSATGFMLVDHDTVTSTNDEALRLARDGALAWTIVRARSQSAGRGRRGRSFVSPPGNSYTSFIVRSERSAETVAQLALVAGLAVAEALEHVVPTLPKPMCKWPNDVLVEGHKICGILVESSVKGVTVDVAIVGIGMNLVSHPEIEGERIGNVLQLSGITLDRDTWLHALAAALRRRVEAWEERDFAAVRDAVISRSAGLNRLVSVVDSKTVRGRFVGLDTDGALIVKDDGGVHHRCVSGSLVLEEGP